jgi:signal transduction histidine kinase
LNPTRKFVPAYFDGTAVPGYEDNEPFLTDSNLVPMLAMYVADWTSRAHIELDFHQIGLKAVSIPVPVATAIYSVVQEALENILHHAEATCVSLVLEQKTDAIQLMVQDNGNGFEVESVRMKNASFGSGLLNIETQAALLNGIFRIESTIGKGTILFFKIPLDEKNSKFFPE